MQESKAHILITTPPTLNIPVNGVVLVHNVDGFALDRELDMDGASAVIGRCQICVRRNTLVAVLCISFLLLLLVGFAVLVLQTILADIIQPSTITASFGIEGVTLRVLESIGLFDGGNDGSDCGQSAPLLQWSRYLLRDSSLNLQPVLAVEVSTQCIFNLNALRIILGLNKGVEVGLLCNGDGDSRGGCKNKLGHYI
jgi:hypothetical protein